MPIREQDKKQGKNKKFTIGQLTDFCYDDIIISMRTLSNTVRDSQNVSFIYTGLGSISSKSRTHLKNIAQTLLAIQAHPGYPLPESICLKIMHEPVSETGELLPRL